MFHKSGSNRLESTPRSRDQRAAARDEPMMDVCTPPVHMEGVGSGLRTFAKPHQGLWGSVRGGVEHVLLRSSRCPVLLSTITSTSCPPSRPFFAMALLPSPFPTMRPTILPGAWVVGNMTRRCVHGCWAAYRAKGTGAHECPNASDMIVPWAH